MPLARTDLLLQPVVLLQVQEVSDVRMPRLQVDGKGSWTLGGGREEGREREGKRERRVTLATPTPTEAAAMVYLVPSLVHVAGSVVVHPQHGNQTIGCPIGLRRGGWREGEGVGWGRGGEERVWGGGGGGVGEGGCGKRRGGRMWGERKGGKW